MSRTTAHTRPDPIVVATSGTLAAIAVLHGWWGWQAGRPPSERGRRRTEVVAGAGPGPSAAACCVVAGLVATASALVAGRPAGAPRLRRVGQAVVATVLGARGIIGLVGRVDLVAPGTVTPQMRRWDRRLYTPLALALAAGSARAARGGSRIRPRSA